MSYNHWKCTNPDDQWLDQNSRTIMIACPVCNEEGFFYYGDPETGWRETCDLCHGSGSAEEELRPIEQEDLDEMTGYFPPPVPELSDEDLRDEYSAFIHDYADVCRAGGQPSAFVEKHLVTLRAEMNKRGCKLS